MSEINLSEIMRDVLRKEKEQKTAQRLQNYNVGRAVPTTLSKCEPSPAVKESLREASKHLAKILKDTVQESWDKNGLIHFLNLSKRVCEVEKELVKFKQREKRLKKQIKKLKKKQKGNQNVQL